MAEGRRKGKEEREGPTVRVGSVAGAATHCGLEKLLLPSGAGVALVLGGVFEPPPPHACTDPSRIAQGPARQRQDAVLLLVRPPRTGLATEA